MLQRFKGHAGRLASACAAASQPLAEHALARTAARSQGEQSARRVRELHNLAHQGVAGSPAAVTIRADPDHHPPTQIRSMVDVTGGTRRKSYAVAANMTRSALRDITASVVSRAVDGPTVGTGFGTGNEIIEYLKRGEWQVAMAKLAKMRRLGLPVSPVTYTAILKGLFSTGQVDLAISTWKDMERAGVKLTVYHYMAMLDGLGKTGRYEVARRVWNEVRNSVHGVVMTTGLYNTMMFHAVKSGEYRFAQDLFDDMRAQGLGPDTSTLNNLIDCALKCDDIERADALAIGLARAGLRYTASTFTIFAEYHARKGDMVRVGNVLLDMAGAGIKPTAYTFSLIADRLVRAGNPQGALALLDVMREVNVAPNAVVYSALISGCASGGEPRRGLELVKEMKAAGLEFTLPVYKAVIECHLAVGEVSGALSLLRQAAEAADTSLYEPVVRHLARTGNAQEAERLVCEMEDLGLEPTVEIGNALINAYGRAGDLESAVRVFENLSVQQGGAPSETTAAALMAAYGYHGDAAGVTRVLEQFSVDRPEGLPLFAQAACLLADNGVVDTAVSVFLRGAEQCAHWAAVEQHCVAFLDSLLDQGHLSHALQVAGYIHSRGAIVCDRIVMRLARLCAATGDVAAAQSVKPLLNATTAFPGSAKFWALVRISGAPFPTECAALGSSAVAVESSA